MSPNQIGCCKTWALIYSRHTIITNNMTDQKQIHFIGLDNESKPLSLSQFHPVGLFTRNHQQFTMLASWTR